MSVNSEMAKIADNIRYRTGKSGLLGLTDMAEEVKSINWTEDPFFAKAKQVNSIEQMTDKTEIYVYAGTIWIYENGGGIETITEQIVGNTDNPWGAGRLSSGNPNGAAGYVTTPYIDLQKYSVPFTLHLKGITFSHTSYGSATQGNMRYSQYGTDKAHIKTEVTNSSSFNTYWSGAVLTDIGDGTVEIAFTPPVTNKSVAVGYARFSGYGTEVNANVYITYQSEAKEGGWVDTGINALTKTLTPTTNDVSVPNSYVKNFMETADYSDSDYSYTNIRNYANSSERRDLPEAVDLEWKTVKNAIMYAVSVNAQIYYTAKNTFTVTNLIPNTDYVCKVYALTEEGAIIVVGNGNFSTANKPTRMLNIEGIQNVRDVGGYSALNGKKVRYGLLFRGSAMDEEPENTLCITENGKYELLKRVGIKTDLDLRYGKTKSALGEDVDFYVTKYGYSNYVPAVTEATHKGYFRDMLEYIAAQLSAKKPVYVHCSGGCDRTGTLIFLLLGVLGVSESDLAKEYELSSFSPIGKWRERNSASYNYKGMVEVIKTYAGSTITDKFVAFAKDCGVSDNTIKSFRKLMLG